MKREDKYQNTDTFTYYNANPKQRLTEDCVIRAVSTALQQDYNDTVLEMAKLTVKTGYMLTGKKGLERYLKEKGWIKHPQPKKENGTKYTGKEWCRKLQAEGNSKRIVAHIGGHHAVAIIYNRVADTWDSTDGCIGNYWTK